MADERTSPKPGVSFFLENIGLLVRMRRANRSKIERFISSTKRMDAPLIPDFEGRGGPMEEGMVYLMFNSEHGGLPIDSVFRLFWVNSPALRFSFLDSFLISEKLTSGRWAKEFSEGVFRASKQKFHQEVRAEGYEMIFDGEFSKGYELVFSDGVNEISGRLRYEPYAVLTYYNGRRAFTPTMAQRFYDIFGINVKGEIEAQGKRLEIRNGRGVIEHGVGIFSGYNIHLWRWLNLQFPEGSVHLFYHPISLKEGIVDAGEGAAMMNGRWYHFLHGDFRVEETGHQKDKNIGLRVPVSWRVSAGPLDLVVRRRAHLSWAGNIGPANEYISDYVLGAEGEWDGKKIEGSGTMENLFHA